VGDLGQQTLLEGKKMNGTSEQFGHIALSILVNLPMTEWATPLQGRATTRERPNDWNEWRHAISKHTHGCSLEPEGRARDDTNPSI
jgi:hypothetical protein